MKEKAEKYVYSEVNGNQIFEIMKKLVLIFLILPICNNIRAQDNNQPIIDMHLHAPETIWSDTMVCTPQPCTGSKTQISNISELLPRTVEEMRKNNVVLGVVSDGNLDEIYRWKEYAPDMFFTGIAIWDPLQADIAFLEEEYKNREVKYCWGNSNTIQWLSAK